MRFCHALAMHLPIMSALAKDRQLEGIVEALLGSLLKWFKQGMNMRIHGRSGDATECAIKFYRGDATVKDEDAV